MATLTEKQFELDGQVFGMDCDVDIKSDGLRIGGVVVRTNDGTLPTEDGRRFGVELHDGETWGFGLFTNLEDEPSAWAAYAALKKVWTFQGGRRTAGAYTRLRYRLGGKTRCIYGRPRRWTPGDTSQSTDGLIHIEADFEMADDQVYDDDVQSETIGLDSPPSSESGVIVPFTPPFTSTVRPSTSHEIVIDGDEDARTWVTVLFVTGSGTLSDAEVQIGDWRCKLVDPVPPENAVLIDPRPWVRSVGFINDGGGVAISPRVTKMANMWLPPGRYSVIFSGSDSSGAATATVSWQNARLAPR